MILQPLRKNINFNPLSICYIQLYFIKYTKFQGGIMDPWHSQKNTSVGNIFIALFFLIDVTNFKMYLGVFRRNLQVCQE